MRLPRTALLVFSAAVTLLCSEGLFSQTPDWDAGAKPNANLDTANFRWWSPPEVKTLRGVLVMIPGRNGDARTMVADPEWQALAARTQFALMGCQLVQLPGGSYQSDPDGSTAKVINEAVTQLAASNGHAYLKDPPLAFWGMSAGSNTSERYSLYFPKRVVAVACIKGTWGPGGWVREKADIPWLVCVGKTDKPDWVAESTRHYEEGKSNHASWTFALHPTEGHVTGNTKPLAIAFLEEAIRLRLAPPAVDGFSSSGAKPGLQKIPASSDWLGDATTFETAPASKFRGNRRNATWLPGEVTAKAWVQYLRGS